MATTATTDNHPAVPARASARAMDVASRLQTVLDLLDIAHARCLFTAATETSDPDQFYRAASHVLAAKSAVEDAMGATR